MLHAKFQDHSTSGSGEEDFKKVFTAWRSGSGEEDFKRFLPRGGHFGHVTLTTYNTNFGSPFPRRST